MSVLRKNEKSWYVLFTLPNHEKSIFDNLKKKGIESFLPLKEEIRQWSDRKKKMMVPCFPNYIFVKTRKLERHKVFEVPGILRFLDSNKNPTVLLEKDIKTIQQLLLGDNLEVSKETFLKGDWVQVLSGPLIGLEGTLIERKGSKRLLVEIKSIDQTLMVDVASNRLKKVPKSTPIEFSKAIYNSNS